MLFPSAHDPARNPGRPEPGLSGSCGGGQAKAQRVQAEADLCNATASARLTRHQIDDLIASISDMVRVRGGTLPWLVDDVRRGRASNGSSRVECPV